MELEYRIPQEDYECLELLAGLVVDELFFQRSVQSDQHHSDHMIAIKVAEGDFIRICTDDWADTEKEAIDCYRLRVERVANPAYAFKANSKEAVEIESASIPQIEPQKVELFEFRDHESNESVVYDAALLLVNGAQRVLIGIDGSSIAGDVYFLTEEKAILERLAQYRHVSTIEKHN